MTPLQQRITDVANSLDIIHPPDGYKRLQQVALEAGRVETERDALRTTLFDTAAELATAKDQIKALTTRENL